MEQGGRGREANLSYRCHLPPCTDKLPTIAVRIVKPQTHVFRSGSFRPDLVTGIFEIDLVFL